MSEEKSIRVISFNGDQAKWRAWKLKFLAKATAQKYRDVLEGKVEVPNDDVVLDASKPEDATKIKAREANQIAYSALALSCEDAAFGVIEQAVTKVLPSGDAKMAWEGLGKKYEPKTKMSLVHLLKEFSLCKMGNSNEDPDIWLQELEHLRLRIKGAGGNGHEIKDEVLMAHILANLPDTYSELVTTIESELEREFSEMTLDGLTTRLRNFYNRKFKHSGNDSDVALAMFKGTCRSCGAMGHKAANCPNKVKKFTGECNYCHKKGHKEAQCFKKKNDERNGERNDQRADVVLCTVDADYAMFVKQTLGPDFFICDSGASSHMKTNADGLINVVNCEKEVRVGNGKALKGIAVGDLKTELMTTEGRKIPATIKDVMVVPDLMCNLLSIGKIRQTATIMYDGQGASMKLGKEDKVEFETVNNGTVFGLKLTHKNEMGIAALEKGTRIDYQYAHELLGHVGIDRIRATAKLWGWTLMGKLAPCESCAIGKGKQKAVPKETGTRAEKPGERLFIDISSVNHASSGGKKYWVMVVDDHSRFKWSRFIRQKSDLSSEITPLVQELKSKGFEIKFVRMDNAGENKTLGKQLKRMGIEIEYTAPDTPQMNGVVERGFAVCTAKGRAMMHDAGFNDNLKRTLWAECFNTATLLENIIPRQVPGNALSPYQLFWGKDKSPRYAKFLRPFGEKGIISVRKRIKGKLDDRGFEAIMLGYADDHAGDCYRMYNPKTRHVLLTRDVTWMKRKSAPLRDPTVELTIRRENAGEPTANHTSNSNTDSVRIEEGEETAPLLSSPVRSEDHGELEDQGDVGAPEPATGETGGRALRPRSSLSLQERLEARAERLNLETVDLCFATSVSSGDGEPSNFHEAMRRRDASQWEAAIKTEFENIRSKGVWRKIKRSEMKPGANALGTKWVFKIKGDERYRARLVVQGYSQIPGVDFSESHSPVSNDATIRIFLVLALVNNWEIDQIDVETAFLYGVLDEQIYLKIPSGYNELSGSTGNGDEVLVLEKALYGLVQAARVWLNTFIRALIEFGFSRSLADPCVLWRKSQEGFVAIMVYVDDCGILGDREAIDRAKREIKSKFNIKDMGKMSEYVGGHFRRDGNRSFRVTQDKLIENLRMKFGAVESGISTPGAPGKVLEAVEEDALDEEAMSKYRSGVGTLLYLVKISRPDISSPVRELSKFMDTATKTQMDAMTRLLNYVYSTRKVSLVLQPRPELRNTVHAFSDSNYATDRDTRRSVSGYAIYYAGALVSWKSKMQQCTTLSSTEAEYVALSQCANEMEFIRQVVESMDLKVELPMTLYVDNTGAIDLAKNWSTNGRTKHVDVRFHYVRELVEQGIIQLVYVRSEDNTSDVMTKNLSEHSFLKHQHGLGMR